MVVDRYESMSHNENMKRKESVTIGADLKNLLQREGITPYRLAKDMGIGQSYMSRLFKDQFNPSYALVKKIAEKLGYEIRFVKSRRKVVVGRFANGQEQK